jgi:ABC-2 type transport system permease protein
VELIRFALYGEINAGALAIVVGYTALFLAAAFYAYNPSKGLLGRRRSPREGASRQQ